MEYFVYISDAKIEMLFEQIQSKLKRKKSSGEVEFNLGMFRAKFSTESVARTRYEKLKIIEDHLDGKIGTVDEPKEYFMGTVDMAWGAYMDFEEMVYFSGCTSETYVGLGGSMVNCVPNRQANSSPRTSFSLSSDLVSALVKRKEIYLPSSYMSRNTPSSEINSRALQAVVESTLQRGLVAQRLKFLAKTVLTGEEKRFNRNVLLGTPIYVALAD